MIGAWLLTSAPSSDQTGRFLKRVFLLTHLLQENCNLLCIGTTYSDGGVPLSYFFEILILA